MQKRIVELWINRVVYKTYIGRRCFNADGTWALGGVAFLVRELRKNSEAIKQLDLDGILRCEYIMGTLVSRYTGTLDPRTLNEIQELLKDAVQEGIRRYRARRLHTSADGAVIRRASFSISRNVKRLVPPDV